MRYLLSLLVLAMLLSGCGTPYRSAVFRQMQTASAFNEVVNEAGSALSRGEKLPPGASREIRSALDDQVRAHGIAAYALEQYTLYQGMLGYEPLEVTLNNLYNTTRRVTDVVHKYLGKTTVSGDGEADALLEMVMGLPEKDRRALLSIIRGDTDGN